MPYIDTLKIYICIFKTVLINEKENTMKKSIVLSVMALSIFNPLLSIENSSPIEPKQKEIFEINIGTHYAYNNSNAVKLSLGFRYSFIGFEAGGSVTGGQTLPSYNDYSVPHGSYYLETYKKSQNYLALLGYYDLSRNVSLKGRIGWMFQTDSTLARSTATGWRYAHSSKTNSDIVAGIGVSIYPYK